MGGSKSSRIEWLKQDETIDWCALHQGIWNECVWLFLVRWFVFTIQTKRQTNAQNRMRTCAFALRTSVSKQNGRHANLLMETGRMVRADWHTRCTRSIDIVAYVKGNVIKSCSSLGSACAFSWIPTVQIVCTIFKLVLSHIYVRNYNDCLFKLSFRLQAIIRINNKCSLRPKIQQQKIYFILTETIGRLMSE